MYKSAWAIPKYCTASHDDFQLAFTHQIVKQVNLALRRSAPALRAQFAGNSQLLQGVFLGLEPDRFTLDRVPRIGVLKNDDAADSGYDIALERAKHTQRQGERQVLGVVPIRQPVKRPDG
jgi:hypothetical protein